jgi:hypothetical protein
MGVRDAVTVGVLEGSFVGVSVEVSVRANVAVTGIGVGVRTNAVTACSVSAAAVLRLETAMSITFSGSRVVRLGCFRSSRAIAETLHRRLIPSTPAAKTASGPL